MGLPPPGWRRRRRGPVPPPRGGPTGVLLERLIFPCRAACLDAGRTCSDTADATAVTWAESTCTTAVEAARTACGADPTTEECQARSALRACAQPCLTARREAAGACHTTVDECLDTCDATTAVAVRTHASHQPRYPQAVERLTKDWAELVTFYRFPQAHWESLRTSNVVESPFAAVRLRTAAGKRFKTVANASALIWKVLMVAETKFRRLDGYALMEKVALGVAFADGREVNAARASTRAA